MAPNGSRNLPISLDDDSDEDLSFLDAGPSTDQGLQNKRPNLGPAQRNTSLQPLLRPHQASDNCGTFKAKMQVILIKGRCIGQDLVANRDCLVMMQGEGLLPQKERRGGRAQVPQGLTASDNAPALSTKPKTVWHNDQPHARAKVMLTSTITQ